MMRSIINRWLMAILSLLLVFAGRWLTRQLYLHSWVRLVWIGILALFLLANLMGFCCALYQRRQEVRRQKAERAPVPAKEGRSPIPWGKLWLLAVSLLMLSPILFTTHWGIFLIIFLFALPLLPFIVLAVGLSSAADERLEEKKKGELDNAKKY